MPDEIEPSQRDNPGQVEVYSHGYASDMTVKLHASRTADKQAGWFLPYLRPGMMLLDCGCGSGSITVGLAMAVAPGHVIGIDISDSEIERARERAAEATITNVRFDVGDIYHLDFPDNSLDAVFTHNVLEHVTDPARALLGMYRVLKPGGVIGVRDIDFGGHIIASNDPLVERYHSVFEEDWRQTGGHPRIGRELRRLLHKAGFVAVKASASYEVYNSPETTAWWSQIAAGRTSDQDFVDRVVGRRLATHADLEQMRRAYLEWGTLPDAFFAMAHGEAVGLKA